MTVGKAILRGQLLVNGPVFIIMMGLMGGLMYLSTSKVIPWYFAPGSILIGPGVAWIYWSYAITKWRIWALTNVEDQGELKWSAVASGLIWQDGSFFERTEIRTPREAKVIHELEQRYKSKQEKKNFKDDRSIPEQIEIEFSKTSLVINILLLSLALVYGVFAVMATEKLVIGIILILIGLVFGFKNFRKLTEQISPLILSNQGIEFEGKTYNWKDISGEETTLEGLGDNRNSYLIFLVGDDLHKINIDDYDISLADLRNKLKIYRGRHHEKTNANKH